MHLVFAFVHSAYSTSSTLLGGGGGGGGEETIQSKESVQMGGPLGFFSASRFTSSLKNEVRILCMVPG